MKTTITFHSKSDVEKWLKANNDSVVKINTKQILRAVSKYLDIPVDEIIGEHRLKEKVFARKVAMYLMCTYTSKTLMSIADIFGGKHWSTVIHSRDTITTAIKKEKRVRVVVAEISCALGIPNNKSFVTL